jgi:hypothetical protein
MVKKIILTLMWGFIFLVVTGALLGAGTGLYLSWKASRGLPSASQEFIDTMGMVWAFGPWIVGVISLLLGTFGLLPGTKLNRNQLNV